MHRFFGKDFFFYITKILSSFFLINKWEENKKGPPFTNYIVLKVRAKTRFSELYKKMMDNEGMEKKMSFSSFFNFSFLSCM